MTGKEMLIKQLVQLLGLDKTLADQVAWAVETIQTFDARLARIEQRLNVALGADNGDGNSATPSGASERRAVADTGNSDRQRLQNGTGIQGATK